MLATVIGHCVWTSCAAQEPKVVANPSPVNYRLPAREYKALKVGKWSFSVEKQLTVDDPESAKKVLERLEEKLNLALEALPKPTHPTFKKLKVFVMHGPRAKNGGRDNGLEFFRLDSPKWNRNMDPRWAGGVVIYDAGNYQQCTEFVALKLLVHEFAHAHHFANWPEDQPDIRAAYENATKKGLYLNVQDRDGKTLEKAYASVNALEYFAELSCKYFVGDGTAPFDRQQLKEYDPDGFAMIQKMWEPSPSTKKK